LTLLSPGDLRHIENHLAVSLDRLLDGGDNFPPHLHPLVHRLRDYVLRGGKRVRPQLCVWAYRANSNGPLPTALLDVACSWEIFHAFLLVHDDLMDAADTRRDIPTLHRQLESTGPDGEQFGQNMAIVAGDLLFGASIRLLAEMDIDPVQTVRLIRLFSRVACTTGFGQAIDLFQSKVPLAKVSEELLLCEYDWKTAAYTFEGPLLSGAILAGMDEEASGLLARYSRAIGQAYQAHNDLLDLCQPAHEGCDIVQGKRTISLMRARSAMSSEHRLEFDRQMESIASANGQAVRLAESLRQDLCATGAIEQTREVIDALLDRAKKIAGSPALPSGFSNQLQKLTTALEQTCFTLPTAAVQK
jgi:geranylgeranyl diphosphate synthase type I